MQHAEQLCRTSRSISAVQMELMDMSTTLVAYEEVHRAKVSAFFTCRRATIVLAIAEAVVSECGVVHRYIHVGGPYSRIHA